MPIENTILNYLASANKKDHVHARLTKPILVLIPLPIRVRDSKAIATATASTDADAAPQTNDNRTKRQPISHWQQHPVVRFTSAAAC